MVTSSPLLDQIKHGWFDGKSQLGCRWCLRDTPGSWIKGFSKSIGKGNVLQVEIWAIFLGLHIATQTNDAIKLVVEIDSKQTSDLLLHQNTIHHPLDTLVSNCRYLLSSFSDYKIKKISRQQNFCADALAKEGRSKNLELTIYDEPPQFILHLYHLDKAGIWLEDALGYCSLQVVYLESILTFLELPYLCFVFF